MAEVSIFLNCGPILTVILGGLLLPSEHVTCSSVVKVLAAFIGVFLITFGAPEAYPDADEVSKVDDETAALKPAAMEAKWYNYILLSLMPILIAFGNLAMGDLRKLDVILIPFYSNVAIIVVNWLICFTSQKGFVPQEADLARHSLLLFLLIIGVCGGLSNYVSWQLKVIGFGYDRVTRVSPLFYLESALALVLDILVFHVEFAMLQVIGLSIIILSFCVIIASAYLAEQSILTPVSSLGRDQSSESPAVTTTTNDTPSMLETIQSQTSYHEGSKAGGKNLAGVGRINEGLGDCEGRS